jgi:phenylacetate-coenzyme A ligase PaaK-like adenylate-forming protein
MEHFDDVLTNTTLRLDDVRRRLADLTGEGADPGVPWRGRWWTAATAGSTGEPAVLVWDRREWTTVLASYARATRVGGCARRSPHPLRVAIVSTVVPTHQSAVVGATLRAPFVTTLRLEARASLGDLVAELNEFQPRVLVGYASVLRVLAGAQQAGELRIAPQAVMSASEVLSAVAAEQMTRAWGRAPFDVYAATETAGIASTCRAGARHLYGDLVVVEPVDTHGSPVPVGTAGARVLVTVLFARTVPLIRYELSDRVTLRPGSCACGLPFPLIGPAGGRTEDTLALRTSRGPDVVDAEVLRPVIEALPVAAWQLAVDHDQLVVLVVPGPGLDTQVLAEGVREVLSGGGPPPPVRVQTTDSVPRSTLGKARPVRRGP